MTYFWSLVLLYKYFGHTLNNRKEEILNSYYKIVLNSTLAPLENMLRKLPISQEKEPTSIKINKSDIEVCYKTQCIKNNLLELTANIDFNIPEYLYYKLDINREFLSSNTKISNYNLEKSHFINNHNQLTISLALDNKYWDTLRYEVAKPFIVIALLSTITLGLIFLLNKLSINTIKGYYDLLFRKNYDTKLEKIEANHKKELANIESQLKKRIWGLEYIRKKDAELNYLFFFEANQAALITREIGSKDSTKYHHSPLCSIILYKEREEEEKIHVESLLQIFSNRFSELGNNISVSITSSESTINFSSKAFLYQIVYSILSYIIFILEEQSNTTRYILNYTLQCKNNLSLLFEFDGIELNNKDDLLKYENKFFQKHANPFILSIAQIFKLLQNSNYSCRVGRNNFNYIEISKKELTTKPLTNNVIKLPLGI